MKSSAIVKKALHKAYGVLYPTVGRKDKVVITISIYHMPQSQANYSIRYSLKLYLFHRNKYFTIAFFRAILNTSKLIGNKL